MEQENRADIARRLVATTADLVVAIMIYRAFLLVSGNFVAGFGAGTFLLLRDSLDLFGKQGVSPGKWLLNMKVVCGRNQPCNHIASIKRNLSIALYFLLVSLLTLIFNFVPFVHPNLAVLLACAIASIAMGMETYKLLTDETGLRLGDLLADTQVVENNL